ncbi:MAG TPA: biotin/lipoyl-containing protein [Acidimicrobiia bacterium]|nr:biotin/lipoyl-containing protein [Acidimicrobiia bacterium]
MATTYPMPKWGVTMESGTIEEWRVEPGDRVAEGDVIGVVSSDKIEVDLEAPANGIVAALLHPVGTTVDCGADLMVLADDEDDYAQYLQQNS